MAEGLNGLKNAGEVAGNYLSDALGEFFRRCERDVVEIEALDTEFGVVAMLHRSASKERPSYVVDSKGRLFAVGLGGIVLEATDEIHVDHPDNQEWVAMLIDAAEERMGTPEGEKPVQYVNRRGKGPDYKCEDDLYDLPDTSYDIDNSDVTAWPDDRLPAHERA